MTTLSDNGVSSVRRVRAGNNLLVTLTFATLVGSLELLRARAGRGDYQHVHTFENDVDLSAAEFPIPQGGTDYDFLVRLSEHESGEVDVTLAESVVTQDRAQDTRLDALTASDSAIEVRLVAAEASITALESAGGPDTVTVLNSSPTEPGVEDSGKTYVIANGITINLPPAVLGAHYRFFVQGSSLVITVNADGDDVINGTEFKGADGGVRSIVAASQYRPGDGEGNTGDYFQIASDGVDTWNVSAFVKFIAV